MPMTLSDGLALAVSISIPLGGGFIIAMATQGEVKGWYSKLKKPSWTPPNWLFGPAWTCLYIMMGVASWSVWKQGGFAAQSTPLMVYAASIVLNMMWTPLFFGMHQMGWALVNIVCLLGVEILTIMQFSEVIGMGMSLGLLGPLVAWTSFATCLNYTVMVLNPKKHGHEQ